MLGTFLLTCMLLAVAHPFHPTPPQTSLTPSRLLASNVELLSPLLSSSLEDESFVSLHLRYRRRPKRNVPREELFEILGRTVSLKKGLCMQFTLRRGASDAVTNVPLPLPEPLDSLLLTFDGRPPRSIKLSTTLNDYAIVNAAVSTSPPRTTTAPPLTHDHAKSRLLDPAEPWLRELGVCDASGRVLAKRAAKWKQINRFLEVLRPRLEGLRGAEVKVVDMGCGRGYLTFGLHRLLSSSASVTTVGIDHRADVVAAANAVAQAFPGEFSGLAFEEGKIGKDADVIVLSPCCHQELRKFLDATAEGVGGHPYSALLRRGIYRERLTEIVTDSLRVLALEERGYDCDVVEFVDAAETPRNTLILGVKRRRGRGGGGAEAEGGAEGGKVAREKAKRQEILDLAALHGVKKWRLATLLGVDLGGGRATSTRELPPL